MNDVVRISRHITHEDSEKSETDAHRKLMCAYSGLVSNTDPMDTDSQWKSAAITKLAAAWSIVVSE